jgi:hypothetical protein
MFATFAPILVTFPIQKPFSQRIQKSCSVVLEAKRFVALLVAHLHVESYVIAGFLRRLVSIPPLHLLLRRSGELPLSWIASHPDLRSRLHRSPFSIPRLISIQL